MKEKEIELIVRGVCIKNGMVLLCHSKGRRNTYLPGGHVEPGESAVTALKRELYEETGIKCDVGVFLGCVEHVFKQDKRKHYEVNLLFGIQIRNLKTGQKVPACEDWIEFLWAPVDNLASYRIEPAPLSRLIRRWAGEHVVAPAWASTYRQKNSTARQE